MARWIAVSLALFGCSPAAGPAAVIQLRAASPTVVSTPQKAEATPKLPPIRPLDGYVLVPTGARLFEGPGKWLQSAKTGYHLDDDWVETIRPMRVVGQAGDFFAVRTHHDEPDGGHCYRTRDLFRGFNLVVYLPKDDALPVLTEPEVRVWIGGTAVQLDRGLGLRHVDNDHYQVVARPFRIELELPAQSIGKLYQPAARHTSVASPDPSPSTSSARGSRR